MTDFMQHTNGFSNFPGATVDPQAQNDLSQTDTSSEQNTQEQQNSQPNLQLNYCECCQTSYKKFYKSCNKCGMPANWKNLLESDRKPLDFYLAKREEKALRIAKSADIYANFKQNQAIKKILPGYVAPKFNVKDPPRRGIKVGPDLEFFDKIAILRQYGYSMQPNDGQMTLG